MKLQSRLITSYVLIIIVTLCLSFITLVVTTRPFQNSVIRARLLLESQRAAQRLNAVYRQDGTLNALRAELEAGSQDSGVRLILIDAAGQVVADTEGTWIGQTLTRLGDERTETRLSRLTQINVFTAADGETFLYASAPIGPTESRFGQVAAITPRAATLFRLVSELVGAALLAGVVALAVSLLLGFLIARSIARPLQQIARATGAVAAGDYEQRVEANGPPEIKQVAASFNGMVEQVEQSQQAMRDFVSNVSHELKTPLTSIQGFSQAILEGETRDEAAQQRAAAIIHEEASRLTHLVEDLLDLARLDSGQVVMAKTPLDLVQILQRTLERLRLQAQAKQIEIETNWSELPTIVGDGDRLAQVFTNLLDNAVKHTPPAGRVKIGGRVISSVLPTSGGREAHVSAKAATILSERGEFVEISIADTGPGIPAADLARIFERLYQIDKSRKRGRGAGLGLAIAAEIVAAHGGAIRAESVEGLGTKFTVLLPLSEAEVRTLVTQRRSLPPQR